MPPPLAPTIVAGPVARAVSVPRLMRPIASVGTGVCPYGPTGGYANPGGVTGFIGPAAGALQAPTNWFVRVGGSNNNGGSSSSLTPDRTGTDGAPNNSIFVSATANFTPADIGKGITIDTGASAQRFKIIGYTDSATVTLSSSYGGSSSGKTWAIGGAWADPRAVVGDANITTNATSGVQSGDNVYIGAGTYRVVVTVPASVAAGAFRPAFNGQVNIVGDTTGQFTGDAGMVQLTAYVTNDKSLSSSSPLVNLNGKSNMIFSNIVFVGGGGIMISSQTATSQNIFFINCTFISGSTQTTGIVSVAGAFQMGLNWRFDRCIAGPNAAARSFVFTCSTGAVDYGVYVYFNNCIFNGISGSATSLVQGGVLTGKPGALYITNCTHIGSGNIMAIGTTSGSLKLVSSITNSVIVGPSVAMNSGTLGQIVEDYNLIIANTARSNVSIGAHSISDGSYAALYHMGQELQWGGLLRPYGEPMLGSPMLGFGNDGTQTLYDLFNRPRPAGINSGLPGVGAMERGNTAVQATSPAPPSGTHIWQFTGPAYQDLTIPVDTSLTTLSIKVQRDANYAPVPGTTLPSFEILANPRIGVSAQNIVDVGSSGGWNTLSAAAFTPTATGWITIRLHSYDATGASVVSFANLSVT